MIRYYSEDADGTIETHDNEQDAESAAEPQTDTGDDAGKWEIGACDTNCGIMIRTLEARESNRREDPSGECEYLCDYNMVDADPIAQIREAFPDIARKLDALDKFEALFAEYSEHMNKVPWEPIGLEDIDDLIERAKR